MKGSHDDKTHSLYWYQLQPKVKFKDIHEYKIYGGSQHKLI